MNTEDLIWQTYWGNRSVREFLERRQAGSVLDHVERFVAQIPHFHGIMLRSNWRETFGAVPHWRREDVISGFMAYLEARYDEWPPDPPASKPEPEAAAETPPPALTPAETAAEPVSTDTVGIVVETAEAPPAEVAPDSCATETEAVEEAAFEAPQEPSGPAEEDAGPLPE